MRVLLTGGSGFVGSNVATVLTAAGDELFSGPATEAALETRLPGVDALLSGLRTELGRERSLV